MSKRVKLVIIGAGNRGNAYAQYALQHPEVCTVVGVAEPLQPQRDEFVKKLNIPPQHVFDSWLQLASQEKFADAAIIATQDNLHVEPAVALAAKHYHLLLEKPMAPDEAGCRRIAKAAGDHSIMLAVCHVLRYTKYTQKLKGLLDSGLIGEIVSMQHLEPVGYWHQAHSFVRGNWRNSKESSFMLMSKSCHDIDWIQYIMGARCTEVSSFGNLKHFTKANKPDGAGQRCLDCSVEPQCPYSAKKLYLGLAEQGKYEWPLEVITTDHNIAGVTAALEDGPYGQCVYECDNDVVDHQVVNMLFDNQATATFTMTAFDDFSGRKTRIFGTRGRLYGDSTRIEHYDFLTDKTEMIEVHDGDDALSGHSGGDYEIMKSFITSVADNDGRRILSGPEETLQSHLTVFAAEKARLEKQVVRLYPSG